MFKKLLQKFLRRFIVVRKDMFKDMVQKCTNVVSPAELGIDLSEED